MWLPLASAARRPVETLINASLREIDAFTNEGKCKTWDCVTAIRADSGDAANRAVSAAANRVRLALHLPTHS
jgi:hypothetical protein